MLSKQSVFFCVVSSIQPSEPDSRLQEHQRNPQTPSQVPAAGAGGGGVDHAPEEPDISTLSLTEKMALFNRLSHATDRTAEGAGGDTRLRRASTRFQTQPITQGEVAQVGPGLQLSGKQTQPVLNVQKEGKRFPYVDSEAPLKGGIWHLSVAPVGGDKSYPENRLTW